MPKIFLSYRRQDSIGVSGRIGDRLRAHFGNDAVFMDIDSIPFGEDFREHIDAAVGQCDVVLAVIGTKWTGETSQERRIDDPRDFVRIELESALNRKIPLIPILIDHAIMPGEADLPPSLPKLAYRNAIEIDQGRDFHPHVDRLIRGIEFHFQKPSRTTAYTDQARSSAASKVEPPRRETALTPDTERMPVLPASRVERPGTQTSALEPEPASTATSGSRHSHLMLKAGAGLLALAGLFGTVLYIGTDRAPERSGDKPSPQGQVAAAAPSPVQTESDLTKPSASSQPLPEAKSSPLALTEPGLTPGRGDAVKLQYRYPEGRKLVYKQTQKQHIVTTVSGNAVETDSSETAIVARTVDKKRADSTLPVREAFESLRVEMRVASGERLIYDSTATDPEPKTDNPAQATLVNIFKLLREAAFTVVLDDRHRIKAVEGTGELLAKAEKLEASSRNAIHSQLEPEAIKAKFEAEFGILPDVSVRPGDHWERIELTPAANMGNSAVRKRYEYVGTEKKGAKTLDKISIKVMGFEFKPDAKAASTIKLVKAELAIDFSDGTVLFDQEAGCVVESRLTMRTKGRMTLSTEGQESPTEADLVFDTNAVFELLSTTE
jgi:hypothetical protein